MRLLHSICLVLLFVMSALHASAQTLTAISVVKKSVVTEVKLEFDGRARLADRMFMMAEGKPRLVLDFKGADLLLKTGETRLKGEGLVESIRFARRGKVEKDVRVVLDMTVRNVDVSSKASENKLLLSLKGKGVMESPVLYASSQQKVSAPRYFESELPYPRLKPHGNNAAIKRPRRKPVIVIDPGHGGNDPGAVGVAGTLEKKITWAASLELKRQLEAAGRYKVIMTRSKDVYVAHDERLRIARAGGADLFLSIHADATANGSARGASVYTLADRALKRSKRIVNSQNWIMDVDLSKQSDPVGDILVDLAQRKTASQSDEFAELLIEKMSKSTRLIGNTHRRAGYFVLLAPDVPAVLLELGFISNSEDEALLNQERHRKKVITSVARAINVYFDK